MHASRLCSRMQKGSTPAVCIQDGSTPIIHTYIHTLAFQITISPKKGLASRVVEIAAPEEITTSSALEWRGR